MALVKKRTGAPAGTIKVSVGNRSYTFDDAANAQVDVSDPGAYAELILHPYLDAVAGSSSFTPPPSVKFAFIVDGTLSEQTGPSTYAPIAGGGSSVTLPYKEVTGGGTQAAIQTALNTFKHVYVGAGTYTVSSVILLKAHGQTLEFGAGVKLVAQTGLATVIENSGWDRCRIIGNETEIDLNGIAGRGIWQHGNGAVRIKKPISDGFWIHNNNTTVPNNVGAVEAYLADRPEIKNMEIDNYAYDIGPNGAYAVSFTDCLKPRWQNLDISHCRIGLELKFVSDSAGHKLDVTDTSDNGVYILGTPPNGTGNHKLKHVTIDNSEEGIVVSANDDVTVANGMIRNCRNKGMTWRGVERLHVLDMAFMGNNQHIGDDDLLVNEDWLLKDCTFGDITAAVPTNLITMRRHRRGRAEGCTFYTTNNTKALLLIVGRSDGSGQENVVSRCTFVDVNKTVTGEGLVRIQTDSGFAANNTVEGCHFPKGNTAIQFFNSTGTPATGNAERRNTFGDITTTVLSSAGVKVISEPLVSRPNELAALLWLDASQPPAQTADAAALATWNDQSGNARNATQATSGSQPTWRASVFNGMPALLFDGTDDFMATAAFTVTQPYELFVVGRQNATGNRTIVDGLTAGTAALSRTGTSTVGFNAGTAISASSANPQDKARLWHVTVNGTSSIVRSDQNASAAGDAGAGVPGGLTIGATGGTAASFWNGYIAEVAILPLLTTGQRQAIRAYFAQKYRDSVWR